MNRVELLAALDDGNVRAVLRVIREGESSQDVEAYRALFGWTPGNGKVFEVFSDHPRIRTYETRDEFIRDGDNSDYTTAAGAFQIVETTWNRLVKQYGFEDFSPGNQDLAAVALIHGRKALDDVRAGRFDEAIKKCGKEWASLPGSPYGQPTMTLAEARLVYEAWGGKHERDPAADGVSDLFFDPDSLATENYGTEAPMAFPIIPLITAFGPKLIELIPQLGSLFGSGSDVQVRNVKAATMAVDAIVKATEQPNLQAAVEAMQEDPTVAKAARAAVAEVMTLIEVGGGVVEARKAAASIDQQPFYKNSAFIFWMTVAPLVYGGVAAVLFGEKLGLGAFSDDAKMMVLTALFTGVLGAGTGFFMGSSLSSQRKDEKMSRQ